LVGTIRQPPVDLRTEAEAIAFDHDAKDLFGGLDGLGVVDSLMLSEQAIRTC
jgi:hypothetical protein